MGGTTGACFSIDPEALATNLAAHANVAMVMPAMSAIVARYGLSGTLVSVGPGAASEEIALLRAGMDAALLFDIDESGSLARVLSGLDGVGRPRIRYLLTDFTTHQTGHGA